MSEIKNRLANTDFLKKLTYFVGENNFYLKSEEIKQIKAAVENKSIQTKKLPKSLLVVLVTMPLLIGFMSGFSITQYIPIQKLQSIFMNFDQEVVNVINSIGGLFG